MSTLRNKCKKTTTRSRTILLVISSLSGGGAESTMVRLANHLSQDAKVILVVLVRSQGHLAEKLDQRVTVVNLDSPRVSRATIKLACTVHKYKPSAILSFVTHVNIITLVGARILVPRVRIVVSERNLSDHRHLSSLWRFLWRLLVGIVYQMATSIIAVSEGIERELKQYPLFPVRRIRVIQNSPQNVTIAPEAVRWKTGENIVTSSIPLILAVGSLTVKKNHLFLIDAFNVLSSRRPCRLAILGEGDMREALERRVSELGMEERVWMPGFEKDVGSWLRSASVFVLTSVREGVSNAMLEALAHKVKVVATSAGGSSEELLRNGRCGIVVKDGELDNFCKAIERVLDDDQSVPSCSCDHTLGEKSFFLQYREVLGVSTSGFPPIRAVP